MDRPLSPHLRVYRFPSTAILSILHRVTGVFLTLGLLAWTVWLGCVAAGVTAYLPVQAFLQSPLGLVCLYLWLFALFLHLCHGVRHLLWDSGRGLMRSSLRLHDALEVTIAVVLMGLCYGLYVWETGLPEINMPLPNMDWRDEQVRPLTHPPYGCDNSNVKPGSVGSDRNCSQFLGNVMMLPEMKT